MTDFIGVDPTLEDYWRSIILFGQNAACYKFALAKSLLEVAPLGKSIITLDELALPFYQYVTEHLHLCDTQSQSSPTAYPFLEACKQFNSGSITRDELIETTAKVGFKVVLDKFHNVNGALPVRFFDKRRGGITITDKLFRLLESGQIQNLPQEVEARWRLVETAWKLNISRNLILVDYDPASDRLFTRTNRRIDVTSSRDALNGYQKGKCFYSFAKISIEPGTENLADVDHFFPWVLGNYGIANIDGVWNLVLSSQDCNRGAGGKFDRLPDIKYLERLHTRNEFLINSHLPLRETLIRQTGKTEPERRKFLLGNYRAAQIGRCIGEPWKPPFEYPAAF